MKVLKCAALLLVFFITAIHSFAQQIDDSLLNKIAKRFEETQHLSLQRIIQPTYSEPGKIPEAHLSCYSGMQVTIVAIFAKKPIAPYGRMLVKKQYPASTQYDEHLFQQAGYEESLKVNYTLLSVYFPPEATAQNCSTVLQVYDKENPDNKTWLIILTK